MLRQEIKKSARTYEWLYSPATSELASMYRIWDTTEDKIVGEDEPAHYDHGVGNKQDPQQRPSGISEEYEQQYKQGPFH